MHVLVLSIRIYAYKCCCAILGNFGMVCKTNCFNCGVLFHYVPFH